MDIKKSVTEGNSKFWFLLIGICIVLLIFVLIGIVSFFNRKEKIVEKSVEGGGVVLKYYNKFAGLELVSLVPTADSLMISNTDEDKDNYFEFSVDSYLDEASSIDYELSVLKDAAKSSISNDDIRIYLEKEVSGSYEQVFAPSSYVPLKENSEFGSKAGSMVLTHVNKMKKSTDNYRLKVWLSDKSIKSVGSFKLYLQINARAN